MIDYQTFLESKTRSVADAGSHVEDSEINQTLYPFQRKVVQWALRKGRAAIFADCGLGKTFMQLEWARLTKQKTLIVAPLSVADQTVNEGRKIGVEIQYCRSQEQVQSDIVITNYEMIDHFDAEYFGAVILDESSILKNIDGKTRIKLTEEFKDIPWRLACTATPAPNDTVEFGNHSEFLGVMSAREMFSRYFVHDDDGWRLKGHARKPFLQWLASWCVMFRKPSDIGYSDEGYDLPPLSIEAEYAPYDASEVAQEAGMLFVPKLQGITMRSKVRQATAPAKIEKAVDIINSDPQQWIVWTYFNKDGEELAKHLKGSMLIQGSDPIEKKSNALNLFINGGIKVLITKPSISGFGLNLQNCHNQLFLGMDDSYESMYQSVRRSWRFGQESPVNVKVVITELERDIFENVRRKEDEVSKVIDELVNELDEYQEAELSGDSAKDIEHLEETITRPEYTLMLGDCVERMKEIESNSVGFSVFSPPFMSLYVYSDTVRDMGNAQSPEQFFTHFDFMLGELQRVMMPGRLVACHVAQVPASKVHDGYIGIKDFRGEVIEHFKGAGFIYHGDVCIDKDPQAQAIRTKAKSLMFVQLKKDSSWLRPGLADYILLFRSEGENQTPVHPDIDNETWIEWARPIWYNIRESDTLNTAEGREHKDERHVCPLQLGTIERCIRLWSNENDLVLSPFMGIGSEGYQAVKLDRRFVGIELKPSYYRAAARNIGNAVEVRLQPMLL